jgi:hypothetical protein
VEAQMKARLERNVSLLAIETDLYPTLYISKIKFIVLLYFEIEGYN